MRTLHAVTVPKSSDIITFPMYGSARVVDCNLVIVNGGARLEFIVECDTTRPVVMMRLQMLTLGERLLNAYGEFQCKVKDGWNEYIYNLNDDGLPIGYTVEPGTLPVMTPARSKLGAKQ